MPGRVVIDGKLEDLQHQKIVLFKDD